MLDDVGTWLGRWMKLHESGWNEGWVNWRRVGENQDWADVSKEALIFATHVFDMAKKNNF